MIHGRFETFSRRPLVDCFLHLPYLGALGGVVPFVMDTGADRTVLMPADSLRLGIDLSQLTFDKPVTGVGGDCMEHLTPAHLIVSDNTTAYGYRFSLGIAEPQRETEDMPSILGMDI